MGPPGSQENSLTLRGHTTKSSPVPRCQTSLLCNFEAQDTAFLECWNSKRSAYTPPTSADPAPQIYFPEGGEWAQQSLKKFIFFLKTIPRKHRLTLMCQPNCEVNIALIWNEMQKSDARKERFMCSKSPRVSYPTAFRLLKYDMTSEVFPGGSVVKKIHLQCRRCQRCGFNPWVRKIPWRRAWQPTPVFLPGESHEQRSLVGYRPCGCKESDTTEVTEHAHTHAWHHNVMTNTGIMSIIIA